MRRFCLKKHDLFPDNYDIQRPLWALIKFASVNRNTMEELDIRVIDLTVKHLFKLLDDRYGGTGKDTNTNSGPQLPEYMDIKACAELTGYTVGYLRQLVHRRAIPFHKKPNFKPVRFLRSEILEFIGGKKYAPINEMADDYLSNPKPKRR